jgi:hypothetical protein
LAERFDVVSQQQGFATHACRRQTGFSSGMATANYDHIKTFRENHRTTTLQSKLRIKYWVLIPLQKTSQ